MKVQAQDKWREWINKNPLRVWKDTSGIFTLNEMASRLGVTTLTLNAWLLGMQMPRAERLASITKVTGITRMELVDWYNQRP